MSIWWDENNEYNDDMSELLALFQIQNIPHTITTHPAHSEKVVKIIWYSPSWRYHVQVDNISIIRWPVSFWRYEVLWWPFDEPKRFDNKYDLVREIEEYIRNKNIPKDLPF